MNYYLQIKDKLLSNEITKRVKDYSINKSELKTYYDVGKLLVEAQGNNLRANYGDGLIKEYSKKLMNELNKKYTTTYLKRMRQFYLMIEKGAPMVHQLSWSHYILLLPLKDINKVNYYINQVLIHNLSKRNLQFRIKNNEYERLPKHTKIKLKNNKKIKVNDFIKNPIILNCKINNDEMSERVLKKIILENLDDFLLELGKDFCYKGNEYKIKIGNNYNYIDLLLFNIEFNCYVVVELKVTELRSEHIGQISKYMNYVDKNIKSIGQDKTIGIIICKKDNKFVMEYCSDSRIFRTTYAIKEVNNY